MRLYNTQSYSHYTGHPALAGISTRATTHVSISSYELEDFVGAKFYCPHALADGTSLYNYTCLTALCPGLPG